MRRRPHVLLVLLLVCVLAAACGGEPEALCEPGLCPYGTVCNASTGHCEPAGGPGPVTAQPGGYLSAALDSAGEVVVAAYDTGARALMTGHVAEGRVELTARVDGAPGSGNVGQWPALCLDRDDRPRIAYYDAANGDLKLARWTSGGWLVEPEPIDGAGDLDVGRYASMVADNAGGLHVAYRDDTNRILRIVSLGDTGCHPPGGTVGEPMVVDTEQMAAAGMPSSDFGAWTSIDIAPDGRLAVSFYDASRGNLVLATCTGSELELTLLDGEDPTTGSDTGDVGQWSSLAVDRKGKKIGVAYFDRTHGALKFAGSRQGTIADTVVDDGGPDGEHEGRRLVGQAAALDYYVGPDALEGLPRIAYIDATDQSIRIARRNVFGNWALAGERAARVTNQAVVSGVGAGLDLVMGQGDVANVVFGEWRLDGGALWVSLEVSACTEATCSTPPTPEAEGEP